LLEFSFDLEVEQDSNGRYVEFGRGVWSAVYKAKTRWIPHSSLLTPPPSPATPSRVLAVKTPLRRDAAPVLAAEARILTRLAATAQADQHVVPFHGFVPASCSLVMSAIPLALSSHIEETALLAKQNFSTRTMLEPVLTMPAWKDLAAQLITGLDWLHTQAGVVHGDIKPHNILLLLRRRPDADPSTSSFQYSALFADFSSAHDIHLNSNNNGSTAALSAVTPPFAAPELMTVAAMKSSSPLSTPSSDVFSLALTLLAAATGDLLLYPGTSGMQRLAMAREGYRVLDFVRAGPHASRIPRGGVVESVVVPAVVRDARERVTAGEW
ncbi:kinase-like domain-containing protein, partial [Talaromyces proteolyticus]